ncbi:MAG TPA: ASKHA domain-containing protein [Gallionella sp.]|nr:ASKHA domain-containing protein [Gallionella sp.]
MQFQPGATLRDILISGGFAVRSACGGDGSCGQCQVRVAESGSIPFTASERLRLSGQQLSEGVRLSCQLLPDTNLHVSLEKPVAQMSWRSLRDDEYSSLALPGTPAQKMLRYGIAIDLGTTHIRLTLWDISNGERIAGLAGLNPQGSYGADVLTRLMEAARSSERARELGAVVQDAIAEALAGIAAQAGLALADVGEVWVVGNTAMLSLLAGKHYEQLLQPENWTRRIDCQPDDPGFLRNLWGVSPVAAIHLVTPLGGFVGSDLLAGVIATRLIEQPAGSLLIDFGTNSEMALWDGQTLHVTAAAGGPAFEGSGISCGMPGEAGAICRLSQAGEGFSIQVLGDGAPRGLCGSGLVDAVAWLLRNGKLDKVGRFTDRDSEGFVLHEGEHRIVLKRGDIDVFQRAKAAIGAGVRWLCQQAGMSLGELHQVYACGAFGRLLDVRCAQQIGLLPPVAPEAVKLEGNSALAGCEALLLSDGGTTALDAVLAVSKVYNLAEDVGFESLFVENLYLQSMQE